VADIASGLKAVGVPVKGRVGVFGANSPEWMITMQARPLSPVLQSFELTRRLRYTPQGCLWRGHEPPISGQPELTAAVRAPGTTADAHKHTQHPPSCV